MEQNNAEFAAFLVKKFGGAARPERQYKFGGSIRQGGTGCGGISLTMVGFDPDLLEWIKEFEGRKWNEWRKCWEFPKTPKNLERLANAEKDRLCRFG
jgi:hypothetical protein